ncbi:hypothetical protein Y032_0356g3356 [Ancylostoma ceylanicum]|uniref:CCHC-type domain-containing protein n=1 Tax=Ancylostoma ceylanicum TaxID=53326 RepID=A0A016RXA3_9BILA|nr:hypothetical protein Y032_0356g3356 [Ancylostoma ceylanicum]
MAMKQVERELHHLLTLLENETPSACSLENDLTLRLEAIHRQAATAATIRLDWNHLKGDQSFTLGGAGEQVLLINRILRAASFTKERIVCLTTHYFLTSKYYEQQVGMKRRMEWSVAQRRDTSLSEVLALVNEALKTVTSVISDLERNLQDAERRLYSASVKDETEIQRRISFLLQNRINDLEQDLEGLKRENLELRSALEAKEEMVTDEDAVRVEPMESRRTMIGQQVQVKTIEDQEMEQVAMETSVKSYEIIGTQQVFTAKDEISEESMPDQDYFNRMVSEVNADSDEDMDEDNRKPGLVAISSDEDEAWEEEDVFSKIRRVNEEIKEMEQVLKEFPYRTISESSRGVENWVTCAFCKEVGRHYSDSCPQVTDGDERYNLAIFNGLCKFCLNKCPQGGCKFRPRTCWYCERIRGTIAEDLIPDDRGHHRALCNVPNARGELRRRIEEAKRQLERLRNQRSSSRQLPGRNVDEVDEN